MSNLFILRNFYTRTIWQKTPNGWVWDAAPDMKIHHYGFYLDMQTRATFLYIDGELTATYKDGSCMFMRYLWNNLDPGRDPSEC